MHPEDRKDLMCAVLELLVDLSVGTSRALLHKLLSCQYIVQCSRSISVFHWTEIAGPKFCRSWIRKDSPPETRTSFVLANMLEFR